MTNPVTQRDAEAAQAAVALNISDLTQSIRVTKAAGNSTTALIAAQLVLEGTIAPLNVVVGTAFPEGPGAAAVARVLASTDAGQVKVKDA